MANILIVDDEPDIIEFIKYLLEREEYLVETASNGSEAIQKAKSFKPELILMDVMMPVMDGIEACRQIKLSPDSKSMFIIFLTARSEEYSEIAGFEAGADDYINKPVKPRVLLSRIKAILKRGKNPDYEETVLKVAELTIDRSSYSVEVNNKKLKTEIPTFGIKQVPTSSVMNPLGTIIYGTSPLIPDDKRMKFKIYFTKPKQD